MKKLTTILSLVILILATGATVARAETTGSNSATRSAKRAERLEGKMEELRKRGDQEIDRRVASLNSLITRLGLFKKLPEDTKSSLTKQVQEELTNLNNLKAKIDADTDAETLKTDIKSIVQSYRVYLLFIPKIHIMAAGDTMLEAVDLFSQFAAKLQARIDEAKGKGKDVASLQTTLTDLQAKLADAKKQAQAALDTVTPLKPEDYPAFMEKLKAARADIKAGRKDLQNAHKDAQAIIKGLKALGKAASGSATPSATASSSASSSATTR